MKKLICFSLVALWLVFPVTGLATEKATCDAIELVEGNPGYNRLICEGIEQVQKKRYAEAAKLFESAMNMLLFEFPNFKLYPRLAMTYFHAGNAGKAKENLAKADLSLSVLIGTVRCEETDKGFRLIRNDGSAVSSPYQAEILNRMCGAAYEYVYTQRSFEIVLDDAKLISLYYQAKKEIEAPK